MMMMMKMKMMIKMIMIKTMAKYLNKMTNIKSFNKLSIKIKTQANPLKYYKSKDPFSPIEISA